MFNIVIIKVLFSIIRNRRKVYNTVESYNLFKLIFVFKNCYDSKYL